jgi:hypothetical protein
MGMVMRQLSIEEARRLVVQSVGFDPRRYDCTAPEVLAALVRRAASFQSPCSVRSLVRFVAEPLRGLIADEELIPILEVVVDELLSYGDLVEVEKTTDHGQLVYPAPPTFVTLASGRVLLMGICPEFVEWLPAALAAVTIHRGHVRSLPPSVGANAAAPLKDSGYYELPHRLWLQAPKPTTPNQVYAKYVGMLQGNGQCTEPTGVTILDPEQPVHYYKGRWKQASGSGLFVARRAQRYGAQLWSFVKLLDGHLESLVDLPVEGTGWRACDEAWWLQAAIDARNGTPQYAKVNPIPDTDQVRLRFFSPIPRWVQRQLDVIGEPARTTGALLSYDLPKADLTFTQDFLAQHLWVTTVTAKGCSSTI